jgi:hypothetical protein
MNLIVLKWLKNNWAGVLVFLLVLTGGIFISKEYYEIKNISMQYKHAQELLEQSNAHDKIVEKLNQVMLDNIEKQKVISLEYQNNLELLQNDYEDKRKEIEKLRKLNVEKLTEEFNNNPDSALKKIAEEYGIEIIVAPIEE